jgi:predicted phosphodiesterase
MIQRAFLLSVLSVTACGNVSGHLGSTRSGDTSHPAERRSPVADLRAACGDSAPMAPVLGREPYLQQVTFDGAMLGWVTNTPDAQRVDVSRTDGVAFTTTPGIVENLALRNAGEKQVWSAVATLQPSTTYCYQVANGTGAMTARTGFKTAPGPDSDEPVRFLAFGDSGGGGSDQYALLDQMYTVPYDLIIHTGDLAYDDGTLDQYEDNVFGVYGDLFRNIPFFPASGNHDYHTMNGAPFREVFNLPGDSGEKWYSYDWGKVHFVALDTESDYSTQAAWLERDLAATDRPWKVVYMHKPPYSSGAHGSDTTLRKKLAPIFEAHHVQLVLSGHDHNYERMLPQHGVAYVVTGGGGVGTKSVGASSFTAFSEDVIHFVYVEVGTDLLVLHAIDANGREFDSMVVPRES